MEFPAKIATLWETVWGPLKQFKEATCSGEISLHFKKTLACVLTLQGSCCRSGGNISSEAYLFVTDKSCQRCPTSECSIKIMFSLD